MPTPPIFISHSHFDNAACQALVQFLADALPDADIFYDERALHGGDDWLRRIQHEVIARPIFIVALSRHSVVAEWVREETNLALARLIADKAHRKVIPVLVDSGIGQGDIDQLAPLLTTRQIIDFTAGVASPKRDDLVRVIRGETSGAAERVSAVNLADLERAVDLANQTHTAVAQGQWATAKRLGQFAVGLPGNDKDVALWGDLGIALINSGEAPEGIAALDTALGLNRFRADLWRAKAHTLLGQAKLKEARQAWDMAFVATGSPDERLAILGEVYNALLAADPPQPDQAQLVAHEALSLAPDDAGWRERELAIRLMPLVTRYDAAQRARQWQVAAQVAEEALAIVPNHAEWRQRLQQAENALEAEAAAKLRAEQQRQRAKAEQRDRDEQQRLTKIFPPTLQMLNFTLRAVNGVDVIISPVVDVPAGPFTMGDGKDSDNKQHTVDITQPYQIGKFPVTVAEYACAVRANAVREPAAWAEQLAKLDHPVVNVSWHDAAAYIAWLARVTGEPWRLPTEAEWEKAARGTDGRLYPWGNQWDAAKANTNGGGPKTTTSIGAYTSTGDAGPYGAHDQAGNVWEWCSSLYKPYPYKIDDGRENPHESRELRTLRGGSWVNDPRNARVAYRSKNVPDNFFNCGGFRLARVAGAGS